MLQWNWLLGNGSMEVPGLPKISQIQTHSSTWHALWWHSCPHAGLQSHLKTPEEPTSQIEHGPLSSEEATLPQWMPYSESHLRKDQCTYSRMVSQYGHHNLYSGQLIALSIHSLRTSSSSYGPTKISIMITLRQVILPFHSLLLPCLHIHSTSQGKWLTYGQRKEVVTAHGTIHTDNVLNSCLKTWICSTSISWQDTQHGLRGTVFHISLPCGWQITWACSVTTTTHGLVSSINSPSLQNLYENVVCTVKPKIYTI